MTDSRRHAPTPRRLARARAEGDLPRSPELVSGAVLLALAAAFSAHGPSLLLALRALASQSFGLAGSDALARGSAALLPPLAALLAWPTLAAVATSWLMSGLALRDVGFSFSGRRRPAAADRTADTLRSVVKLGVVAAVLAATAHGSLRGVLDVFRARGAADGSAAHALVTTLLSRLGVALLSLGVLDFVYALLRRRRRLRMTRRELDDERRQSELPEIVRAWHKQRARDAGTEPS